MLGVSEDKFWDSTPKDLEPYAKMDEMRQKRRDSEMWQMGMYNLSAFGYVVAKALGGTDAEYPKKPFSLSNDENMTEEEKQSERDKLIASLQIMQANFDLTHENDTDGG
jgi:hypothetical protein